MWRFHRNSGLVSAVVAGVLASPAPLLAQDAGARGTRLARQLAESEARVKTLQQRVERLERRLDALAASPAVAGAAGAAGMPRPDTPQLAAQGPRAVTGMGPQPPRETVRTAQAGASGTRSSGASGAGGAAGGRASSGRPGSFEVDEDAAQRALERTLTQTGALLLPPGAFTFTPEFGYARNESATPELAQITDPNTGITSVVLLDQNLRRNEFALSASLKAGLPWESQLELDLPWNYVRSSRRNAFGGDVSANGSGFGDLSIGIAKTLLREKGALPDLIGRLTYNSGLGRRNDGLVALSGGFRGLTGELVALKRQDPLAFFASASYSVYREDGGIKPGNQANLSFGTVLAASPATSLQFGFSQTHRQRQELNGVKQPGSDQTYGMFSIGASSVLSRDVMLITSLGVGVGGDAPDYSLNISLPITFR